MLHHRRGSDNSGEQRRLTPEGYVALEDDNGADEDIDSSEVPEDNPHIERPFLKGCNFFR